MRQIELEPAAKFRTQRRLAERVVDKPQLARSSVELASEQLTQGAARNDKALPVALKPKPRGSAPFVIRERRVERFGSDVEAHGPTPDLAHHRSSRTASARATTTSRGPSNASRPCAVRMLSTTSKSPACHGSRTVCASYVSLIVWTISVLIGSPVAKQVLNGSPSAP